MKKTYAIFPTPGVFSVPQKEQCFYQSADVVGVDGAVVHKDDACVVLFFCG
ncbi:MAG: hypothetical protein AAFS06_18880 [Cyanobacteria bacterium J06631_12]